MTPPPPTGRLASSVAAALLGALTLLGSTMPLPAGAAEAGGSITLIGQSPWVDSLGVLAIDLRVTGSVDEGLLTFRLHESVGASGLLGEVHVDGEALPDPDRCTRSRSCSPRSTANFSTGSTRWCSTSPTAGPRSRS